MPDFICAKEWFSTTNTRTLVIRCRTFETDGVMVIGAGTATLGLETASDAAGVGEILVEAAPLRPDRPSGKD